MDVQSAQTEQYVVLKFEHITSCIFLQMYPDHPSSKQLRKIIASCELVTKLAQGREFDDGETKTLDYLYRTLDRVMNSLCAGTREYYTVLLRIEDITEYTRRVLCERDCKVLSATSGVFLVKSIDRRVLFEVNELVKGEYDSKMILVHHKDKK